MSNEDDNRALPSVTLPENPSRRTFLKTTAAAAAIAAAPALLTNYARAAGRTLKIGLIAPKSGVVATFAEPLDYILKLQKDQLFSKGVTINGVTYPIEIIVKDSRSDPNRASEAASELIKSNKVDLMLTAINGDTVNPVADLCEINGVPCVTDDAPWQIYFFGRNGNPAKPFKWTYHYWWGVDDLFKSYIAMWNNVPTNKVVGALWPNDFEGIGFSDKQKGFPPALQAAGYRVVDPGRFQHDSPDYAAQISTFKKENCEILTGVLPTPAFTTFWSQAAQQGYKPKVLTMAKGMMFPSAANALGDRCLGLSSEMWWSPYHPFKSGLSGITAKQLCDRWQNDAGKQWTPPVGGWHSLLDVAYDVLKRTKNVDSRESILESILATNLDTVFGHVQWTNNPNAYMVPVKNVCRTVMVGGQWVRGKGKFKYELLPIDNTMGKMVPVQGKLQAIKY